MKTKKLQLPTTTLFGIDRHDKEGIKHAVEVSTRHIDFAEVVLITDHDMFEGREQYSKFMIERLNEFVKTEHVITVHSDGFVQCPEAWDNSWLQYDYIGAVWNFYTERQVGNGGASLRSKKLLEILSKLDLSESNCHPEDDYICRQIRYWLEKKYKIKFAPVEVANKFSIEAYAIMPPYNRYSGQFMFHGYHCTGLPEPPIRKQDVNNRRLIRK